MSRPTLAVSLRRIAPLAWPVFVGQIAGLAFATVDTLLAGRHDSLDLAALAIGGAAYATVFMGLMGMVLAVAPLTGQLYGAGQLRESGRQLHQAVWLALGLAFVGCTAMLFPEPFLALSQASAPVAAKVRDYLRALAFALPPTLVLTAFRGFNNAVSRPKAVMALQLGALLLKIPLSMLLVSGIGEPDRFWHVSAHGAAGCGAATAIAMWLQCGGAWVLLRRDRFYDRFEIAGRLARPDLRSIAGLLRLGIPMGLSIGIEVAGFTFMAFFVARLGASAVAGHQIAVNLVSMMFMMPFAIANATSTLVAQRVGAGDAADAARVAWHGLELGVFLSAALGATVFVLRGRLISLYSADTAVLAAALPLLAWVGVFHVADAAQTVSAFVLRAYGIAVAPMAIYAIAIWGIGIGGGYSLAFAVTPWTPVSLRGAPGFWSAATVGLAVAALAMTTYLRRTLRRSAGEATAASPLPDFLVWCFTRCATYKTDGFGRLARRKAQP